MTATYVQGTDIATIRLYGSDTNLLSPIFSDEELLSFLTIEGDVRLAAAAALERMASDKTLLAKVRAVGDISLDGISLAKQLMANAANLRDIVEKNGAYAAIGFADIYMEDVI